MTKKKLNNMEYSVLVYFLIKALFVGITFNALTKIIKQDSWIIPICSIFIGLLFILLLSIIINYKEKLSIIDKVNDLFDSKIKYFISLTLIAIGIFYNIINTLNLNNFIHTQFLNRTPILIISISFLLVTLYILTKGINSIAKTSVIIFYICIFLAIITFVGLIPKFSVINIKPILRYNSHDLFNSLKFFYFFNINPLLFITIIPKSNIKNPKIFKSISLSYILSIITIFLSTILTIGVFGIELTSIYEYPEFQILKQISLVGISSRIESFLVIQLIFDLFIYNVIIIYFICNSIKKIIKKDLNINLFYFFYIVILIILLNIISNHNILINNYIFNILTIISLLIISILCIKIKLWNKSRQKYNTTNCTH